MTSKNKLSWNIKHLLQPNAILYCKTCKRLEKFASSGQFRVNANGKKIDAWLIYRCVECDQTWNRPIYERKSVYSFDSDLLFRLFQNDPELSQAFEYDSNELRKLAGKIDNGSSAQVHQTCHSKPFVYGEKTEILIEVVGQSDIRLDRLLAVGLSISREKVIKAHEDHKVVVNGLFGSAINRKLTNGIRIELLGDDWDSDRLGCDYTFTLE